MPKLLATPVAEPYVRGFSAHVIANSDFTFENLIRYHLASVVTLVEQGLTPPERARRLVGALLELQRRGMDSIDIDASLEDLQPNVERAIVAMIGPEDASDFGIARARAEFVHVSAHLSLRDELLQTLLDQLKVNDVLLDQASRHLDTIVQYYTQHMRAEPITFGYYFSAFSEAFLRDAQRMRDVYGRFMVSPAGIGHIVPTPLAIDRKRLAQLCALGEPVFHSLYSYLNGELYVDAIGAASLTASSISRLLLDLWWWASDELDLVRFQDEWCGGSFIMPHKRNPSWMKACRFATINVKAKHNEAQELWLHGAPMFLVGSLPIPRMTYDAFETLRYACELLTGAVATATIDAKRARAVTEEDFVQSSQLVSLIVGKKLAGWRQAEHVVGPFVKEAIDQRRAPSTLKYERLLEIGQEQLGKPLQIDRAEFDRAMDVTSIVASRGDCGPAPDAVRAAIDQQRRMVGDLKSWAQSEQARIAKNWAEVERLARAI